MSSELEQIPIEQGLVPERGFPPPPDGWPVVIQRGPAIEQGLVPPYMLGPGSVIHEDQVPLSMEVQRGGDRDRLEICDVVVVGSGAGGAVIGKELAEAGFRVVILEEGDYFKRDDFAGPPVQRFMRMCYAAGSTATFGKSRIPVPIGRTVGGTTTVNSGSCFRAPRKILDSWAEENDFAGLDYDSMDRHFHRVESTLSVRPVPWELLGPNGWLAHYGAAKLKLTGGPITRNIKSCHGTGQCVFGCPTDAKQAMHVSYLPRAVRSGAKLYCRTKAERIVIDRGKAAGIKARFLGEDDREEGRLEVKAPIVVIACGAIGTPLLLQKNRIGRSSGQVGENLTIHPAVGIAGWFSEPVYGWRGTLQPYYIDSLLETNGVMIEATNSVPSVSANLVPGFGLPAKQMLAGFAHMASLGLLVADTSRGRVRRLRRGEPRISYRINEQDTANLYIGLALAAEVLLAAGAFSVSAGIPGLEAISDASGIEELRRGKGPSALKLSAYHPAGTARMGSDPSTSVVDGWLQSHEVPGMYISDASVFPGCLGVNPQMTIMALATRTAERISESRF
jgi:choline dehydrogenase-like flavoprotein